MTSHPSRCEPEYLLPKPPKPGGIKLNGRCLLLAALLDIPGQTDDVCG